MKIDYYIFDFDGTAVDTIGAVCKTYNKLYKDHPCFIPADPTQVCDYSFRDQCPLINDIQDIFGSQLFFDNLEPMRGALRVLKALSAKHKTMICTQGHNPNIALKSIYIENTFKFVQDVIYVNAENKRMINMENCIFFDDHIKNLTTCNARLPVAFGDIYPWNVEWTGHRIPDWAVVESFISELLV